MRDERKEIREREKRTEENENGTEIRKMILNITYIT